MAPKYQPLLDRLSRGDTPLEFRFEEIADLVGGLPASAYTQRWWWANTDNERRVQARAWLDAGRTVEHVDLGDRLVRFSAPAKRRQ